MTRRIDTEATALQRQGELGIWASLLGQEAAQIGSGRALHDQDFAFPTYREHGVAWCRGVDPLHLLGLFRGVDQGGWDPLARQLPPLHDRDRRPDAARDRVRDGHAARRRSRTGDPDRDAAVIAYFGDGATSQGDVNEAFIWASVFNAPVVFFCQNNQWAISEPIERQTRIPLYQRAPASASPASASTATTCSRRTPSRRQRCSGPARAAARRWSRPTRTGWAPTPPPTTRRKYRLTEDLEHWKLKDPIERVKAYLSRNGVVDDDFFDEVEAEADELAAHLREGCLAMPDPSPLDIFDHVYVENTPELEEQKAQFAAYLASFDGAQRAKGRTDDGDHARQGRQHGPARGDGGRPQGHHHG